MYAMVARAKQILKEIFGYDEFRPMQEDVISNVLNASDTLAVMPTGSGKSLCYQIPALMFSGLTIVVSPLISLMQDQINQLEDLGVNAVVLNSAISKEKYYKNIGKIKSKQAKILYIAPESLVKENVLSLLNQIEVSCLTIDEAHCISEWGHDFRPEYRMLVDVRKKFPNAVVIALTATATSRVQQDIRKTLGFAESNTFISSFNRENLMLEVKPKQNPFEQTISFLREFPNQSGIIYCFSRKQVDILASELEYNGFSVLPYHAGLSEGVRKKNQDLFIKDDVQIIVATIAFGMGINKPNVRFVIHYDLPKNIEGYYQEIGRAGRDGLSSECLLLFSYADINKIKYFINQKQDQEKMVANIQLNSLISLATSLDCRRKALLTYFGENYTDENCGMCDNCLDTDKEKQNLTVEAQKLLSCVKRTGEFFGASHVIDVLRGSNAKKIIEKKHDKLSTHGIGKDLTKQEWMDIVQQLINNNCLKKDDQYGSLKFTQKSYEICSSRLEFFGVLPPKEAIKFSYKKQDKNYDVELFEILRCKRKELADKANIPPYIVFSDKALIEMCTYFPQNKDSMLNINGVGTVKMKKYGDIFLDLICEYAGKNNIEEQVRVSYKIKSKDLDLQGGKMKKHVIIGREYNEGASLTELKEKYKIKMGTVIENLFKYVESGETIRSDDLLSMSSLSSEEQNKVFAVFDKRGCQLLRPVYDELDESVSYEEIRLMRVCYLAVGRSDNSTSCEVR